MNQTQIYMSLAILAYIGACVFQWKRLSREEKRKKPASQHPSP